MKEKIKEAAKKYSNSIAQSDERKTYCVEDFTKGAEYALSNQWHDLRTNPNDLPPIDKEESYEGCDVSEYVLALISAHPLQSSSVEYYNIVYYFYNESEWLDGDNNTIYRDIIAWMPIPKFNDK